MASDPLWIPTQEKIDHSNLKAFIHFINEKKEMSLKTYEDLYQYSISKDREFWDLFSLFSDIKFHKKTVSEPSKNLPFFQNHFFKNSSFNYAENVIPEASPKDCLIFQGETMVSRCLTCDDVRSQISKIQQFFIKKNIQKGDRIAAYLPNFPETIITFLAASSLGAIWSSCSPDFGVNGVLDRFGQISPKIFIAVDGYYYNGKYFDCSLKIDQITSQLPSIEATILIPYDLDKHQPEKMTKNSFYHYLDILDQYEEKELFFESLNFNHPLYILYSSGTTGIPKCIVHGGGGSLIQHKKEHLLHCDVKKEDRLFYFTTCGWMMWNWLVSGLACQTTLLLYDGFPFLNQGSFLFDFLDKERATLFGTSAKYIDAIKKINLSPIKTHTLSSLKTITSTGSPLVAESFDYVYTHIKKDVHLASIAGGTDIVSCFVLGNPIAPIYRGEIQTAGLGMAIDVFDENGHPLDKGKGELVCKNSFPSMPVCFWNDPVLEKYKSAYFDKYPNIWCHGDYMEKTKRGGYIIHGRSDATLNPGGVRIGTAEIYRQVEQIEQIMEAIVVGQEWDQDIRIILFVKMRENSSLTNELKDEIKKCIKEKASPRHVPAKIIAVEDIPRTKSGKITELAVRDIIHGKEIKNISALANPEALDCYRNLDDLKTG